MSDAGNEEDNMDMCIDIYLATYRKEDDLELPEEIQARINELDSMIAEEDDPLDKMQIYMEIATLFLGNFALNCSVPSHS
jgi:hypothetical protein